MPWPLSEKKPEPEVKDETKPPEKTPADLIAESLTNGLKPVTDSLTSLSTRLEAIEAQTRRPAPKPEQSEQPISVLDDENMAFAQRMTPLLARQLELEARVVKSDIKAEYASAGYGDLWTKYERDINDLIDKTPLATSDGKPFRGDPQYIRNVVDMVFGREARKAGMQFDGKERGFFLETGSGSEAGSGQPLNDGLTDSQRKVLDRMKVPTAEAKKIMAKLKFV